MFHQFAHRHTPCQINGQAEAVILSRETKGTTVMGKEYVYNGLFAPDSIVQRGDIVQTDDQFLVLTIRNTTELDLCASLLKTNVAVDLQRHTQEYDGNDNPIGGPQFVTVSEDVPAFAQLVSASLLRDEPGLLPTTKYVLTLQTSVPVKEPKDAELISPDRIMLAGRAYQVDVVDRIKYPNLLHVQLSEDMR